MSIQKGINGETLHQPESKLCQVFVGYRDSNQPGLQCYTHLPEVDPVVVVVVEGAVQVWCELGLVNVLQQGL